MNFHLTFWVPALLLALAVAIVLHERTKRDRDDEGCDA